MTPDPARRSASNGTVGGLPQTIAHIPAGGSAPVTVTVSGASLNSKHTIPISLSAQDGMGGALAPVSTSATFTTPWLP